MWLVFAVSLVILSIILLGSFVWSRDSKSALNVSFAFLSYVIACWMLANFIGANFKEYQIASIATRLDFVTGCVLGLAGWSFAAVLLAQADVHRAYRVWYGSRVKRLVIALVLLAMVSTFIPGVIHIGESGHGALPVLYGRYYVVFAICLALVVSVVVLNILLAQRIAKGRLKQQVGTVLFAMALGSFFIGFVNLVLPQISTSANINLIAGNLSYLGVVFFVGCVFYSIIRHRLFDLRLILARSVAYALVVVVLTIGYGALTLLMSNTLIKEYKLTGRQTVVPIVAIILLAFTVSPLGKFFNKLTNRLFYKDSYEPQQFLGELNRTIIANIDISALLSSTTSVIEKYLKIEFGAFDLRNRVYTDQTPAQSASLGQGQAKIDQLRATLDSHNSSIIVADELSRDQETLHRVLLDLNIAVVARLSASRGQDAGYILLGHRKNGGPYTTQDLEMVNVASGVLAIAIQNAMRFEEIDHFNQTLQEKVEDATRQLRRTNDKLRKLDETKDDFISMASHQLRTPLTSVKGYVSMVLDGDAGSISKVQRKLLTQSFISSQRMVYLISDLLNVSRLKTGNFILEPVSSNLAKVVQEEVSQLQETAKGRNLELTYRKPEQFPVLMLDETKLRQVVMNFIDNAVYYTPSGGHITVSLVDKPKTVELTVVDDGIGVPRQDQHHLFTKFFRAHNAKRSRPDGTGLGLFMAKKVIVAQGGAVIFKSQEGRGSTFGFSLVKSRLMPPDANKASSVKSKEK